MHWEWILCLIYCIPLELIQEVGNALIIFWCSYLTEESSICSSFYTDAELDSSL